MYTLSSWILEDFYNINFIKQLVSHLQSAVVFIVHVEVERL